VSSTATKTKDEKSEHQKELEQQLADLEDADDGVEPEEVPADTAAELERVKHIIAAQFGIDTRSPGQVKQAEIDGLKAEIALEEEQAKVAKAAEDAAKAEAEAAEPTATTSSSSKSK